jgi:hypothetical protein
LNEWAKRGIIASGEIIMSTTSNKSRTRKLSEAAMTKRVHTSRADRDLTVDGLDKHHHEAKVMKAVAKSAKTKTAAVAKTAKSKTR